MKSSRCMEKARRLIQESSGRSYTIAERCERAVKLAAAILKEARRTQSCSERRMQAQLARMLADPKGRAFTTQLTDQAFRSSSRRRIARQINYLMQKLGIPHYLGLADRLKLQTFHWLSPLIPRILVPLATYMMRRELAPVIIPANEKALLSYLKRRKAEGVQVNLNHLGEAILGEEEAERQLQLYLDDLARPEITYVSVKISSICSHIDPLAWDTVMHRLKERLSKLYATGKFVNLDMESYHDLALTVALFRETLEQPEFQNLSAGIVLQAYLPDSAHIQRELTEWAMRRVDRGGAPIKLRIVRGANLAMEKVEASLHGWPQTPYATKAETDANFKRMVTYALEHQHAQAVHIGIGSHNLLDIAYALLLRAENQVEPFVTFEMLEGMADPMRRVVQKLAGELLLYAPAAHEEAFQTAVAYLIRRLDENTGPENFLRHAFDMKPGSPAWTEQTERFLKACSEMEAVSARPQRQQNRFVEPERLPEDAPFKNEPDTDWSLTYHRRWARQIVKERPAQEFEPVDWNAIDNALEKAKPAQVDCFAEVAQEFRRARGDLINAMVFDGNKTVAEADREVSEAVDFIEYYRRQMQELRSWKEVSFKPRGTFLIAPPWNFPCAIPTSGIASTLITGNAALFKPAPETVLVGARVAQCFWNAGIPEEALQFLPCRDEPEGSRLVQDARLAGILLTGAAETARKLLLLRPELHLIAETGGKNALIITDLADRDLSIRDLVQSAFGHAGQKCSAASLAILHKELYDSPTFRHRLRDAARSLRVGSPWDLATEVPPLIRTAEEPLLSALTTLDPGEEWLLKPVQDSENPNLWSPGIKLGVQPGSRSHRTEFFGPVLSVMCAESLDDAIALANDTPYGLTGGIHSLDQREIEQYLEQCCVGNAYVNRTITGAIVRRQPFGGCKASSFGPGAKVGGPNFLGQLLVTEQKGDPTNQAVPPTAARALLRRSHLKGEDRRLAKLSASSYSYWWAEFCDPKDPSHILGQDNYLKYVPREGMIFYTQSTDSPLAILKVLLAAATCGAALDYAGHHEDEGALIERLGDQPRIRMVSPPSEHLLHAVARRGGYIDSAPPLATGRFELLHYVREVAVSWDIHRYGHLAS